MLADLQQAAPIQKAYRQRESLPTCQLQMPTVPSAEHRGGPKHAWRF
jgi:hypothetical protein